VTSGIDDNTYYDDGTSFALVLIHASFINLICNMIGIFAEAKQENIGCLASVIHFHETTAYSPCIRTD